MNSVSAGGKGDSNGNTEEEERFVGSGGKKLPIDPKLHDLTLPHRKLLAIYGDIVYQNDGTHLGGGIADNKRWQACWIDVVSHPLPLYDLPKGNIGN